MKKYIVFVLFLSISITGFSQFISYPPQLLGGNYNYRMVFDQEFYYPPEALKSKVEGEVKIDFLVDKDGKASDFHVIKSVHPQLDSAYIDILKRLVWLPGTQDGAVSDMRMIKSEKFKIKKYLKLVKARSYDQPPYKFTPYNALLHIIDFAEVEISAHTYYQLEKVNIFKFISEYIKIPDAAVKRGLKGVVELEFIIEPSGRLSNFKEIKGVGGGCTEEAIRLMQMLDWEPAQVKGEYVRSSYRIKVNFGNTKY